MTTVQIVLWSIRAIKFLQAMQTEGMSVEVRNGLISEALPDASGDDVADISREITTIDPKFLKSLCEGIGEALSRVLGKE